MMYPWQRAPRVDRQTVLGDCSHMPYLSCCGLLKDSAISSALQPSDILKQFSSSAERRSTQHSLQLMYGNEQGFERKRVMLRLVPASNYLACARTRQTFLQGHGTKMQASAPVGMNACSKSRFRRGKYVLTALPMRR